MAAADKLPVTKKPTTSRVLNKGRLIRQCSNCSQTITQGTFCVRCAWKKREQD